MPKLKNRDVKNKITNKNRKGFAKTEGQVFWRCVTFSDTVKRYCEITMKKDEVSPLHAIAMFYLVYSGGVTTPTKLAEVMFRSKHSVTKIIDNLEKEGFITRDFSSKDRRVTRLRITEAGRRYAKGNLNMADIRSKQVTDCLDAEEQKSLVALMGKMCDRMINLLEKLS